MKPRLFSVLISSALVLIVFAAATWLSCNKDRCVTMSCYNGGVCHNGLCTCSSGYEGVNCSTESRQKFLGNWQQTGGSGTLQGSQFAVSLTGGLTANSINIINFDNGFTQPVTGSVTSSDSLIISTQTIQGSVLSGAAYYAGGGIIQVNYTVTSPAGVVRTVSTRWIQ